MISSAGLLQTFVFGFETIFAIFVTNHNDFLVNYSLLSFLIKEHSYNNSEKYVPTRHKRQHLGANREKPPLRYCCYY